MLNLKNNSKFRSALVALFLFFAIFFHSAYPPETKKYTEESVALKFEDTFMRQSSEKNFVHLPNAISVRSGNSYRLIVKNRLETDNIKKSFSPVLVEAYVSNGLGNKELIGKTEIGLLNFDYAKELTFSVNFDSNDLYFYYHLLDGDAPFTLRASVLSFSELDRKAGLKDSVIAGFQNDLSPIRPAISQGSNIIRTNFNKFLVTDVSQSEKALAYVDVNMIEVGKGSNGLMCFNLYRMDQGGDPGKVVASKCIDSRVLYRYQIDKNYYRFPLSRQLDPSCSYSVIADLSNMKSNFLNYYKIVAHENGYREINNRRYKYLDSGITLVYYRSEFSPGTIIEDLGKNNLVFRYRTTNTSLDMLSLGYNYQDNEFAYWDYSKKTILSDKPFVLNINLSYKITSAFLGIRDFNDRNISNDLSYLLPNKNWQKIPKNIFSQDSEFFQEIPVSDNGQNYFTLKSDPSVTQEKRLSGFSNMEFWGQLQYE